MSRTDSAVMAAFRDKAGLSRQGVVDRRNRLRKLVIMPPDMATYVAAHRAGVDITRYLDEETVRKVAEYDERVHVKEGGAGPVTVEAPKTPRRRSAAKTEVVFPNFKIHPGGLSASQMKNAQKMAAEVYPLLYAFENSVREFVDGHLRAAYGKNWWDREKLVSKPVRDVVKRNQKAKGSERWVLRASAHPIYLTELGHLGDIIISEDGWKVFKKHFPRQSWVTEHVKAFEQPRNVVAHMNPLQASNMRGLEIRAREWFDQIKDHAPA